MPAKRTASRARPSSPPKSARTAAAPTRPPTCATSSPRPRRPTAPPARIPHARTDQRRWRGRRRRRGAAVDGVAAGAAVDGAGVVWVGVGAGVVTVWVWVTVLVSSVVVGVVAVLVGVVVVVVCVVRGLLGVVAVPAPERGRIASAPDRLARDQLGHRVEHDADGEAEQAGDHRQAPAQPPPARGVDADRTGLGGDDRRKDDVRGVGVDVRLGLGRRRRRRAPARRRSPATSASAPGRPSARRWRRPRSACAAPP